MGKANPGMESLSICPTTAKGLWVKVLLEEHKKVTSELGIVVGKHYGTTIYNWLVILKPKMLKCKH